MINAAPGCGYGPRRQWQWPVRAIGAAAKEAGLDGEQLVWAIGDGTGLSMPAHPAALRAGGAEWLTRAFRAMGALGDDNAVARIARFEDCPRGSTGRKVLLTVEYARADPALDTELFVKFSRALDDPLRDNQRFEMEREARFAAISRAPGFPIAVATCYFADFEHATGTGIMITACVPYGEADFEPHYEKCMDWAMPDQIGHYRAIIAANARLGGAHRAGRLPAEIDAQFPFDAEAAMASDPIRYDDQKLGNRIARFAGFCAAHPGLLPANVRAPAFHERLAREVPRLRVAEPAIKRWLYSDPAHIVFGHWNANVDNAWFWREAGELHAGFIDWGRVGPMNVAQALWGTLSGAEIALWDAHLDELIALYASEFAQAGGGALDPAEVRLQLDLLVALLGVCWLLDAVALIERTVPDLSDVKDRFDPRIAGNELARNQLHMLGVFMNLWDTHDIGARIDEVLKRLE